MNQRRVEFFREPKVKKIFGGAIACIVFIEAHRATKDPIAVIKKAISPVIMPVEVEGELLDLWEVTVNNLPKRKQDDRKNIA